MRLSSERSPCACPSSTHVEWLYVLGIPGILIIHTFITAAFLIIFGVFLQIVQNLLSCKHSRSGLLSLSAAWKPRPLNLPAVCLTFQPLLPLSDFFKSFPAATSGTVVVSRFSQSETFQHADVGRERNHYKSAFANLALKSMKKRNHLSIPTTCALQG